MKLEVIAIEGIGEVEAGDDLAKLIADAARGSDEGTSDYGTSDTQLRDLDVLVVTQKIVSKAEGRIVEVGDKDPKEIVRRESTQILRQRGELIISQTSHGFICANAGVDFSNVPEGYAALLPKHPDRSASRIKEGILQQTGAEVAVIVSDTFGRPWRRGLCDVAIGCAGILPILDLRGSPDARGRELAVTEVCIVDELASAAELVMGKSQNIPATIIRGTPKEWHTSPTSPISATSPQDPTPPQGPTIPEGVVPTLIRHPTEDLFR